MFPTAYSQIHLNSDGEPIGWDMVGDDASDFDPAADLYGDQEADDDALWGDQAGCEAAGFHGNDGNGTDRPNVFECIVCGEEFTVTDD